MLHQLTLCFFLGHPLFFGYFISAELVFTSSPGALGLYPGDSARMNWTINQPIDKSWFRISLFKVTSSTSSVFTFNPGTGALPPSSGYEGRISGTLLVGSADIYFTLSSLIESDFDGAYQCAIRVTSSGPTTASSCWLFIYGKPATPAITYPSDPVENTIVTLTCDASSTSTIPSNLPTNQRPNMTYSWQRDNTDLPNDGRHTVSGTGSRTLTISTVQRQDNGKTYTCTARETGSRESNEKTISMNVRYPPSSATTKTPQIGPLIERENTATHLICDVTDAGNPPATFTWTRGGSSISGGQSGTQTISANSATLSDHDAVWTCTPTNSVGTGGSADITVTVNARATLAQSLPPSHTAVVGNIASLSVTCGFISKPAAAITWTYNDGSLPTGVRTESPVTTSSGKKWTVTQRLVWNVTAAESDRRDAGGSYVCRGQVALGAGQVDNRNSMMQLTVQYSPYSVSLNASSITVTEGDEVAVACSSVCSPTCNFSWKRLNDSGWSASQQVLVLSDISRHYHDQYTCTAGNTHGQRSSNMSITVNFAAEVKSFSYSPPDDVIQNVSLTLTCDVISRPESDITITNTNTYSDIVTVPNTHRAVYTFSSVQILDSAVYKCSADNRIKPALKGNKEITLSVKGGYEFCEQPVFQNGVALYSNLTAVFCLLANPFDDVERNNWSFLPLNKTNTSTLPKDVHTVTVSTSHLYKKYVHLLIPDVRQEHYGEYTLTVKNSYNAVDLRHTYTLIPQGKPAAPIDFQIIDVTAVSITVQWRTGFNGGLKQTFTIKYKDTATGDVNQITDIPDTGTGSGHLMEQHIRDGIKQSTQYELELFAGNNRGSTSGGQIMTTTLVLPVFNKSPQITLSDSLASIHFVITGPLTHISVENCVKGKDTCRTDNVTVTGVSRRKRQAPVYHDFTDKVPLVDSSAAAFTFKFWMYDGDVLLYEDATPLHVGRNVPPSSQSLIIGAVVGSVAAVAIIAIILIVLWRKGIIPGKRRDPDDDQSIRRPGPSTPENGQSNPGFDVIDPVEPEYSQVELNRGVALVPAAGSSQPPVYAQVDKNRKKPKPTPGADPAALYSQVDKKGKKSKAKPVPDDPAALYSQVNKPKKKAANNAQAGPSQPGPSQDPDPAAMYSQVNKPGKKGKPPAPPAACLSQPAATDSPSLRGADPAALYSQVDKTRKQTASDAQPAPSVDEPESAVYSQVNKPGKKPEQSASPRASMYPPVATARQPKPAQPQVPQNAKNKPPKKGLLKLFKGKEPKPDASISGATYENVEMGTRAGLSTRVVGEGAYVNVPDAGEQDGVYSEVRIQPVGPEDTGRNGFQRIGADGTTYAELDFIKKNAVDNGDAKVHGAENRTEYASIDIAKLLPKQDKTKKK